MPENLYVHFPFCRRKCSYCALHSRAGSSEADRADYVARLAAAVRNLPAGVFRTVYFGGGSPGFCRLEPLFSALAGRLASDCEFSVELHPLDVKEDLLKSLRAGGVNRISLGVQSLDDATLADMGRGYIFGEARRAFALVKRHFENAGIDLIVGYPGEDARLSPRFADLADWGLQHCSVYSLILEEHSILYHRLLRGGQTPSGGQTPLPDDDVVLDKIQKVSRFLRKIGLMRYEISNYSTPGRECRHNCAVWRGEDYLGLGDGAHGRIGRLRTENAWGLSPGEVSGRSQEIGGPGIGSLSPQVVSVSPTEDETERLIFRLRMREGLDVTDCPKWGQALTRFEAEGLLERQGSVFRLTERGTEVCDAILTELV